MSTSPRPRSFNVLSDSYTWGCMVQREKKQKRTHADLSTEIRDPRHTNLGSLGAALLRAATPDTLKTKTA